MTRRVARGAFASAELDRALRRSGLAGRERAQVTDLVYGALRHRQLLDAALAPHLRAPERLPDDVMEALRLGAFEKLVRGTPPHAAVGEWVRVVRGRQPRLAGLANAVLRRVARPEDADDATLAALPEWIWGRMEALLGREAARRAAAGMLEPEPMWLRAFPGPSGGPAGSAAEHALASLHAEGHEALHGPLPGTLRARLQGPLAETSAYREGRVQPQNPASAWVVEALAPSPGERVLDLAGGHGVKAAALAAQGAHVTSVELVAARIERARSNLARLGLEVTHRQADLGQGLPADLEPAPAVLLDAPCTGTGTVRGHPEIKERLGGADVRDRAALQARLLATAADAVEPGGRLVYAVCALTPEEGPERTAAFLREYPAFRAATPEPPLPHVRAGAGVVILPVEGLDGFFVARLERS